MHPTLLVTAEMLQYYSLMSFIIALFQITEMIYKIFIVLNRRSSHLPLTKRLQWRKCIYFLNWSICWLFLEEWCSSLRIIYGNTILMQVIQTNSYYNITVYISILDLPSEEALLRYSQQPTCPHLHHTF